MSKLYQIGEAAELTGLSRDTLRFYEKKGILKSIRMDNGYRLYTESDIAALISIRYRRHMNHSLNDIENDLIGERFSVENMKRLTEEAILREEDELKRHELSLKRLRLTRRDIDDIEMSLDKCLRRPFPKIYEGPGFTSYMEAIRAWFQLCSERDGLDMCYLMDRYEGEAYIDTALIFFAGVDEEIEAALIEKGWRISEFSGKECQFTISEGNSEEMPKLPKEAIERMAKSYVINMIDSYKAEEHTRFRGIYTLL